MKLFNRRKKDTSNLPPEIQAYAQAEHRERVGMAWLVGLVSLIVTVLVLAGLYFGGTWVYRKLSQKDKTSSTAQTDKDRVAEGKKKAEEERKKNEAAQAGKTDTTDVGSNHTDTPVQAPTPAPTSQPATGDSSSESLVRTGPDIDL